MSDCLIVCLSVCLSDLGVGIDGLRHSLASIVQQPAVHTAAVPCGRHLHHTHKLRTAHELLHQPHDPADRREAHPTAAAAWPLDVDLDETLRVSAYLPKSRWILYVVVTIELLLNDAILRREQPVRLCDESRAAKRSTPHECGGGRVERTAALKVC